MKNYIFFDLDGTLTDPKEGITNSVAYSLEYFGIHTENNDTLCKFIGPPLKYSYMTFCNFDSDKADIAVTKYREYFAPKGLYENKVYKGIPELLQKLKDKGFKLVVATSKPYVYSVKILKHFDLYKYFDFVSGSELDGRRTNKAEVIKYALDNLNISAADVIMIGDREHDIIGAVKNGVKAIGVLYGYGSREEFEKAGADYIVENVEGIWDIICRGYIEDNQCRVIKISKKALFEFICEKMIDGQSEYLETYEDLTISLQMDYNKNSIILIGYNTFDRNGKIIHLPENFDFNNLFENMEDTTDSMFSDNIYKQMELDELMKVQEE